jgi:hypothetical protein
MRPGPVVATALALVLLPACESLTGPRGGPPAPITELPRALSPAELEVIRGSNVFAMDLLRESVTSRPAEANVFLSPLSASMALGMTMNGAAGETWTQMRDALGFAGLEEPALQHDPEFGLAFAFRAEARWNSPLLWRKEKLTLLLT